MKTIRLATPERNAWNEALSSFPMAHPFQSYGWGRVRETDGWSPSYFMTSEDGRARGMAMVLSKTIPGTGLKVMYAPRGPVVGLSDREALSSLLEGLRRFGLQQGAVLLRLEPSIREDSLAGRSDPFREGGLVPLTKRWSFWNSPRDVYRVDLSRALDEEQLFSNLDKDARRCVRKAHREGVEVRAAQSPHELRSFYELFAEFSISKGFLVRKLEYQEALWKEFIQQGNGRLFLTMHEGRIIGGLICLLFGRKCVAMHMGAPYRYHQLQPYYAFVWESIRWAWAQGCVWYSFRGVGTTAGQERFKRKFAPEVVPLVGYYDLPLKPLLYRALLAAEFQVLPRVWPVAMRARRVFKRSHEEAT